jgi:hypothetical protein
LAEEEEDLVEAAAEAAAEEEEGLEAEEEDDLVGMRDHLPKLLVRFPFCNMRCMIFPMQSIGRSFAKWKILLQSILDVIFRFFFGLFLPWFLVKFSV